MNLFRIIPIVILTLALGCTHRLTTKQMDEIKQTVIEGQREAIQEINRPLLVSPGPEGARYIWRPPVIEYVTMPSIIVDGVYIQGGKTPVVVRTGFFEFVREQNAEENVGEEGSTK